MIARCATKQCWASAQSAPSLDVGLIPCNSRAPLPALFLIPSPRFPLSQILTHHQQRLIMNASEILRYDLGDFTTQVHRYRWSCGARA